MKKNGQVGRPKKVVAPLDLVGSDKPDNYPTLLKYLEKSNRIKQITYAQVMRSRHLFITKGLSSSLVAKEVGLPVAAIERMIVVFGWEETRDEKIFNQWRSIADLRKKSPGLDARHDRIAGTIESVVEKKLESHVNGNEELSSRDLSMITNILKSTQDIRRTAQSKPGQAKKTELNISIDAPEMLKQLGSAVQDLVDVKPMRAITVETSDVDEDSQYEEKLNDRL